MVRLWLQITAKCHLGWKINKWRKQSYSHSQYKVVIISVFPPVPSSFSSKVSLNIICELLQETSARLPLAGKSAMADMTKGRTTGNSITLGCKINADGDCSHEIKRGWLLGRKAMTNLNSILKSRNYSVDKGPSSQSYGFSSSHLWMWELDYKESWDSWESLGLQGYQTSPSERKSVLNVHWKDWCWS